MKYSFKRARKDFGRYVYITDKNYEIIKSIAKIKGITISEALEIGILLFYENIDKVKVENIFSSQELKITIKNEKGEEK